METLAVLGLIFVGATPAAMRSSRNRSSSATNDLTMTSADAAAPPGGHPHHENMESIRVGGVLTLVILAVTHVLSLVLAATGNSLTQPTDIITSLISPLVFLILKIAGVIGVQQ